MRTIQERVHSAPKPDGWKLDKLHRVLRVRRGYKNAGMEENNLLSLSYGRVKRKDIDGSGGLLPESFETYQIVESGNIVMRLTDLQNDKRSIRQGMVTERGIITSAYDALEATKGNEPRFWAYALLALDLPNTTIPLVVAFASPSNSATFQTTGFICPTLPPKNISPIFSTLKPLALMR